MSGFAAPFLAARGSRNVNAGCLERTSKKAQLIPAGSSHTMSVEFKWLPSGCKYNRPRCGTNRLKTDLPPLSFVFILHLLLATYVVDVEDIFLQTFMLDHKSH